MKFVLWPLQWMKVLPFVAVSGSLIFACLTQWAGGVAWVEMMAHFRVYVLMLCVVGMLLFVVGLSLSRAGIGLAVAVWLAWPMAPYYFKPDKPEGKTTEPAPDARQPAPDGRQTSHPPPEIQIAVFNLHYRNQAPELMDEILRWNADLVVLTEVSQDFYRTQFQRVREVYAESWMGLDDRPHGTWCFTRLPVVKDLCQTRSKATGVAACDWTLKLGDAGQFRWVALHVPSPIKEGAEGARRKAMAAAADAVGAHEGARVLAGDLNCTPFSERFKEVLAAGRLRDSALGYGLSGTWSPFPLVGLPLDHVLISDHWQVIERRVGDFHGSDHRSLLVKLKKAH